MKKLKMSVGYSTLLLPLVVFLVNANDCPDNFISLGNFCYHFSGIEENWEVARGACGGIGSIMNEYVIPAVLDLGTAEDNQLLLKEVNTREDRHYWLGGYIEDERWQWIYNKEKDIDLYANYLSDRRARNESNCMRTTNTTGRTYIEAANCTEQMKVICQIIPGYYGFRDIGNGKYYFSTASNTSASNWTTALNWTDARTECQSMQPPTNFDYVDLASSVDPDTDQQLLKIIAQYQSDVWLGGYSLRNDSHSHGDYGTPRTFKWVDERIVDQTSYLMADSFSNYNDYSMTAYIYAYITSETGKTRARLVKHHMYRDHKLNFVCQAYKN